MLPQLYKDIENRMKKAVEATQGEFAAIRTGRANASLLDHVVVEAYGTEMPLRHIANVSVPDARSIVIQPHDKSILGDVRKAIERSDLGITPNVDGNVIRLGMPPLTEERRKEMVKHLHRVLEDHRTAIRNIRRDGNEAIKKAMKDKKISEDDERNSLDQIQKLTDDEIKKMEEMSKAKEKEVLEIK